MINLLVFFAIPIAKSETIAWWHLDEGQGKTSKDETDNKQDLKLVGNVKWAKGRNVFGLEFDGSNGSYAISKEAQIDFPGSYTIAFWFYARDMSNRHVINTVADVGKGQLANVHIYIRFTDGVLKAHLWSDAGIWENPVSTDKAKTNRWHHFAYVFDGKSRNQILYLDGKAVNSLQIKGNKVVVAGSPPKVYVIGAFSENDLYNGVFDGIIDEVQVSDVALTEKELVELMRSAAVSLEGNVASCWGTLKSCVPKRVLTGEAFQHAPISPKRPKWNF